MTEEMVVANETFLGVGGRGGFDEVMEGSETHLVEGWKEKR